MTRFGAAAAYRQVDLESKVTSASAHELIAILFKELRQSLLLAEHYGKNDQKKECRDCITKACRILAGLQGSLDYEKGGEIAANLGELYGYSIRKLFRANVQFSVEIISEIRELMDPILEAWDTIGVLHNYDAMSAVGNYSSSGNGESKTGLAYA